MIALKSEISFPSSSGILTEKFITVQAAAEMTGYNPQYLRRILRTEKLESIKIGQVWLIKLDSLEQYLQQSNQTVDKRFGPKITRDQGASTTVNTPCIQTYSPIQKEIYHERTCA
jgi:excisionase family DNA binding protein